MHSSQKEVEQSTFNIQISEGIQQQQRFLQLEQQHREVFHYGFNDHIANYLESMSNIRIKVFFFR